MVASHSHGIDRGVKGSGTGFYCLHVPFVPTSVVATIRTVFGNGETTAESTVTLEGHHCAAGDPGYNVTVNTYDSAGTAADKGFYIAIN